ncbi:hypothetical protein SLEP1_g37095 [Rubroshorea leprosula]|uniref:Uncharacterized protein n=1 Tax=Rubroshorea leprosula TaxID=152421 RepID=A0AAV5KTN5_9ROSI|nr:hypothetical protein SLEP1_g37095 [Rubroshorea leprosula]
MAMASSTTLLHLLVLLLGLSHILCLNAVPVTRIGSVVDQIRVRQVSENIHLKNQDGNIINPRLMLELNDYPGSGANNRHTPSKT